MEKEGITTKAAKCVNCGRFHLIASIDYFNTNAQTRKDFSKMMREGFQIIDVTTQEARDGFGYCDDKKVKQPKTEQLKIF